MNVARCRKLWVVLAACAVVSTRILCADDLAQRVLIVYNAEVADSKPLAEYYAQKRGVPTNQLCEIRIRDAETITRREFDDQIREPILEFMGRRGLLTQQPRTLEDPLLGKIPSLQTVANKISYVVLMYGVPLRIDSDPSIIEKVQTANMPKQFNRDEASVESELALLPTAHYSVLGPLRNPFYGSGMSRFESPLNRQMVLVGRLDGPDHTVVRRMIDDALTAEHYGVQGRAYFDARGTKDKAYVVGDDWIKASYRMFRDAGYECDLDETEPVFDQDYPMTDAAIYAGWYTGGVTGPFVREGFRFKPGAIAYHLHSSSGQSVRTRDSFWVGPLLAKGAAATMGNVFEPYLSLSPHIDMFFKRLLEGGVFLEAGYYSQPALSWQTTFVGDPLYRPFAVSLDDQIANLEADNKPDREWAYVRKVNLLMRGGEELKAEALCRAKAETLSSTILQENLGDLLHATYRDKEAIKVYGQTIARTTELYHKIRLFGKLAAAYERDEQPKLALAQYEQLIALIPNPKNAIGYYRKAHDLAFATGDNATAKVLQARIDELLKETEKK
ncbi:MAG: TIGR03790 family protein [Verrucomicrobiia bacterium]|jgi:uncharacterized protein (TIGR03790 family)